MLYCIQSCVTNIDTDDNHFMAACNLFIIFVPYFQINSALEGNLIPSLGEQRGSPADHEALRIYLSLPYCKLFDDPQNYSSIQCPFAKHLLDLTKVPARIIGNCVLQL